jgi:hypothetical protein
LATTVSVSLCVLSSTNQVQAYRPFQGTDAAVADLGELETEFGPAEPMRAGPQTTAETVLNLGIAEGWEAVLQGQAVTLLSPGPVQTSLLGNAFFLTHVLRDGVLQDKPGPSVAIEFGPLLPGINGAVLASAGLG